MVNAFYTSTALPELRDKLNDFTLLIIIIEKFFYKTASIDYSIPLMNGGNLTYF